MQEGRINILELIPQRAPIVMIDAFDGITGDSSYSTLTVRADNIFCVDGSLTECGIIEHIAQSAAARVGYVFYVQGVKIPTGYIASVNNLTVDRLPQVGDTIKTELTVVQEVFNITLISARCMVGDTVVAQCRMKIFLNDDSQQKQTA